MTNVAGNYLCRYGISTHILTKRMTEVKQPQTTTQTHFNSHPHEEDDVDTGNQLHKLGISTHILTKRMTERR